MQVVTYKWLGRKYNVPFDTAKRILFDFLTRHPQAGTGVAGGRQAGRAAAILSSAGAVVHRMVLTPVPLNRSPTPLDCRRR